MSLYFAFQEDMDIKKEICNICGRKIFGEDYTEMDDQILCPDCLAEHTVICQECSERIWINENVGSREYPLCWECFQRNYTRCSRCNALLRQSSALYQSSDEYDERPYCDSCYV